MSDPYASIARPVDKSADPYAAIAAPAPARETAARPTMAEMRKLGSGASNAVRQGMTFGWSDEIAGFGAGAVQAGANVLSRIGGHEPTRTAAQARDETTQRLRDEQSQYQAEHPVENVLLQLGGGLAVPGMGAASRFVGGARSLGGAVVRSAAVGAGTGAVAGAGNAEGGAVDRAAGAGTGALVGAVVGATAPAAIRVGQTATRAATNVIGQATGGRIGGPLSGAAARLRQTLEMDGVDPAQIARLTQDWQATGIAPPALMDVAGENTRALLRMAASKPGPARNTAVEYAERTRENLQGDAIARARDLTPAEQRPAGQLIEDTEAAREAAARTDYAPAYAELVDVDPATASALRGEPGMAALRRARSAAVARRNDQQVAEIDQLLNGDQSSYPQVSAGTLDRVRIAMRGRGERMQQSPDTRDIGGGLRDRAADIDASLDAVPGLAPARANYRAHSQQIEAVDVGRQVLGDAPDDFATAVSQYTPEALNAARVGARQQITDALGQGANASPVLNRIARAENVQRNLRQLFGDAEANRYIEASRRQLQRRDNASFISPNTGSQTQTRGQDANLLGDLVSAVRNPVAAILERVSRGLTLTDAEREILLQMGTGNPLAAMGRLQPTPAARVARQTGARLGVAAPMSVVGATQTGP